MRPVLLSISSGAWAIAAATVEAAALESDAEVLRNLWPLAVAGLVGGFAVSLLRPNIKPVEMVKNAALGLIVGGFIGALLPDLAKLLATSNLDWLASGGRALAMRGVQLMIGGMSGFGAQWILLRLQGAFQGGEIFAAIRQVLRAWLLREPKGGANP